MKWTLLKPFSHVFSLTNPTQWIMPLKLEILSNCIYMNAMYWNEKFSNLVDLELCLSFQILFWSPYFACWHGRVRGLKLTMLPLFMQSHIIGLLPSIEKSFNFYDGFGKSALIRSFKPRNLSGENFTYGMAVVFKKYKRYNRGRTPNWEYIIPNFNIQNSRRFKSVNSIFLSQDSKLNSIYFRPWRK